MKFLNNRIEELQREKEDAVRRYEEQLTQERGEAQQKISETVERMTLDR